MKEVLDKIFEREILRFDELSRKEPLDRENLQNLELLVRALKNYQAPEKDDTSPLEAVSTEDLIKFIRGETGVETNAQPGPVPSRPKASGPSLRKRRTVAPK
jgi:hypothetical protein